MNTVRNLTARQRRHFTDVVSAAATSLKQAEIARQAGVSPSTVSRVLATREAAEAVEAARARALAESWSSFEDLLKLSIQTLRNCLTSHLVPSATKARIAGQLLQIGLNAGTPAEDERREPITIVFGDHPENEREEISLRQLRPLQEVDPDPDPLSDFDAETGSDLSPESPSCTE